MLIWFREGVKYFVKFLLAVLRGCEEGTWLKCSCEFLSGAVRVGSIPILLGDRWGPPRMGEGMEVWAHVAVTGIILFYTGPCDSFLSHSHYLSSLDHRAFPEYVKYWLWGQGGVI